MPIRARGRSRPRPSSGRGKRFVLIASTFHSAVNRSLVRGAVSVLRRAGVPSSNVRLVWVPGSFELPLAARRLAKAAPRPHAVIALGTLIRGETPQYDAIAHAVARGLMEVAVSTGIPVGFGVVVAETPAQARARAGGRLGHRGEEAALAVLELLRVFEHTDEHRGR